MAFPTLIILLLTTIYPSQALNVLPHPSKSFLTSLQTAYLIDETRLDPFSPTPKRRGVAISTFYPLPKSADCNPILAPYMSSATAAFEDSVYSKQFGIPNDTFANLRLSTYQGLATAHHPVILFSPGYGTTRFVYSYFAQTVASAGYVVVMMDHPYDADVVEIPGERLVLAANLTEAQITGPAVETRAQDASFILDRLCNRGTAPKLLPLTKGSCLDVSRVGFFGHSLGGAAAAATMFKDSRVVGGLDMDGAVFGPVVEGGLDRPFLLFGRPDHGRFNDTTWAGLWSNLRGERFELALNGSKHITFSDLPFLADFLGFRDQLPAELVDGLLGTINGTRAFEVVSEYVIMFMDHVLKGKTAKGLREPDSAFPEVTIVPEEDLGGLRMLEL